jgi:hypothetical protein
MSPKTRPAIAPGLNETGQRKRSILLQMLPRTGIATWLLFLSSAAMASVLDIPDELLIQRCKLGVACFVLLDFVSPDTPVTEIPVFGPAGATLVDPTFTLNVSMTEPGNRLLNSDLILISGAVAPNFGIAYGVEPLSDTEPPVNVEGPCPPPNFPGPCFVEDGTLQHIGSVAWSDGSIDNIFFKSDTDTVPEPHTILLVLPVMAGLMLRRRRGTATRRADGADDRT